MPTAYSQEQVSVPAHELAFGDIIQAWRGTWRILEPMLRKGEPHGYAYYLRVVDYHDETAETMLKVRPCMEFATLRRRRVG